MLQLQANSDIQVIQILESDIIIDGDTITLLKQMFCDKEAYSKYISVLWTMRGLLHDKLIDMDKNSFDYENQFILFDTLNKLINAIYSPQKEKLLGFKRERL